MLEERFYRCKMVSGAASADSIFVDCPRHENVDVIVPVAYARFHVFCEGIFIIRDYFVWVLADIFAESFESERIIFLGAHVFAVLLAELQEPFFARLERFYPFDAFDVCRINFHIFYPLDVFYFQCRRCAINRFPSKNLGKFIAFPKDELEVPFFLVLLGG